MIKHPALWEDVRPGHYIEDKNGKVWLVDEMTWTATHQTAELVDWQGKRGKVPQTDPLKPVVILILDQQEIVQHTLSATEVTL